MKVIREERAEDCHAGTNGFSIVTLVSRFFSLELNFVYGVSLAMMIMMYLFSLLPGESCIKVSSDRPWQQPWILSLWEKTLTRRP